MVEETRGQCRVTLLPERSAATQFTPCTHAAYVYLHVQEKHKAKGCTVSPQRQGADAPPTQPVHRLCS